jgi:hypothetical protein
LIAQNYRNLTKYKNKKGTFRVFENRLLRRIFGSKWEEVLGCWRRIYNEEFHELYISPNIVRFVK